MGACCCIPSAMDEGELELFSEEELQRLAAANAHGPPRLVSGTSSAAGAGRVDPADVLDPAALAAMGIDVARQRAQFAAVHNSAEAVQARERAAEADAARAAIIEHPEGAGEVEVLVAVPAHVEEGEAVSSVPMRTAARLGGQQPATAVAIALQSFWPCPVCTFSENAMSSVRCVACDAARPELGQNGIVAVGSEIHLETTASNTTVFVVGAGP